VDARVCGDAASEKIHLEEAYRLDPKMSLVANNLAHVLSQPPTADLTRALNLIDAALDREPSNSNYLETRGQIYRSMGRWKEALLDFEIVLSKAPNTNGIHSALAEVYEKLNLPDLAAQHKALAAEAARTKSSAEAAGKKP
jgi:tetratricopeptide (TPR) repeat protein